jgi:hypothetical protein
VNLAQRLVVEATELANAAGAVFFYGVQKGVMRTASAGRLGAELCALGHEWSLLRPVFEAKRIVQSLRAPRRGAG